MDFSASEQFKCSLPSEENGDERSYLIVEIEQGKGNVTLEWDFWDGQL